MIGLMNKAIEGLVVRKFGEAAWVAVQRTAGCADEPFVSMESYPDEVTVKLVHVAAQQLNIPVTELLMEFGRHWMLYTAEIGYGGLLPAAGQGIAQFLTNLNTLHTRLQLCLPYIEPPHITVANVEANSLVVHYRSRRLGFTPVAHGILEALGQRFGLSVEVAAQGQQVSEGEYTIFFLTWPDGQV